MNVPRVVCASCGETHELDARMATERGKVVGALRFVGAFVCDGVRTYMYESVVDARVEGSLEETLTEGAGHLTTTAAPPERRQFRQSG